MIRTSMNAAYTHGLREAVRATEGLRRFRHIPRKSILYALVRDCAYAEACNNCGTVTTPSGVLHCYCRSKKKTYLYCITELDATKNIYTDLARVHGIQCATCEHTMFPTDEDLRPYSMVHIDIDQVFLCKSCHKKYKAYDVRRCVADAKKGLVVAQRICHRRWQYSARSRVYENTGEERWEDTEAYENTNFVAWITMQLQAAARNACGNEPA